MCAREREMIYWFNFMGALCLEDHCRRKGRKMGDEKKKEKVKMMQREREGERVVVHNSARLNGIECEKFVSG